MENRIGVLERMVFVMSLFGAVLLVAGITDKLETDNSSILIFSLVWVSVVAFVSGLVWGYNANLKSTTKDEQ